MKKNFFLLLFALSFLDSNAQVGINTPSPRTDLDVNGSFKSDNIIAGTIDGLTLEEKDRYLLLTQDVSNNGIKRIDPRVPGAPGIATIATYKLQNASGDWVERFNTKINTTDYSLVILSAYFDRDIYLGSSGILSLPSFGVIDFNGFWNLYADYSQMSSQTNGTWTFVCAIYPKTYVKIFGERVRPLGNTSSGTESTPILNP